MSLFPDFGSAGHLSAVQKASRAAFLVLLCAAASLCLTGVPSGAIAQQSKPKAPARSPVADPVVIDLQSYRDLLTRHRGKPLMVYFWATWCEPCREEYPMLVEVVRRYAPKGLAVIGISLDEDAEVTLMRRFLERNKPDFPNYRKRPGDEEAFINAVDPKWTGAIPATFFYSRDGREVGRLVGEHKREEFEKAIQALLEPDAKSSLQPGTRTGLPGR